MTPQDELTQRYREALHAWATYPSLRKAAKVLGLNKRQYCDQFVALTPIVRFSCGNSTAVPTYSIDPDAAWCDAMQRER